MRKSKTPSQLSREIEDQDLAAFAHGKFKYNATQRARLGYVVQGILRDRGIETGGLDDAGLAALARAELARSSTTFSHATQRTSLGSGAITEEQALMLPRFDFIAHWLAVVTRKKENRGPLGKQVKHSAGRWKIVGASGLVEYETPDADRLFDYARRGELNPHIRDAEEFRVIAHQRAGG